MPLAKPPSDFNKIALDLANIAQGERYARIFPARHADPLGYSFGPSRFSDPRPVKTKKRFGVLYMGESLEVCFLEAILRDLRDGAVGDYPLSENELRNQTYAEIEAAYPLRLVDLRDNGPVRMGIPSDVVRSSRQTPARRWSLALFNHPTAPDGIIYPSRLNGRTNLAIYDRAIPKLRVVGKRPLVDAPGFADLLDLYNVALV